MNNIRLEKFYISDNEYILIYHSSKVKFIIDKLTVRVINNEVISVLTSIAWPNRIAGPRTIDLS